VTYVFGDGSIAALTFSAKGHAFEGVKERYAAHRGNTLIAMDDFQRLVADVGADKEVLALRARDHGHEESVRGSYQRSRERGQPGLPVEYVWEAGQLFLQTRAALEGDREMQVSAYVRAS